ncbi:MAG TPA: winged helix-turn-helix domain-containing protein [Woeseiaceae bacterium]|nr:winged helix-turn-helix domain-containing protein [Woeseiaceae bacterium]
MRLKQPFLVGDWEVLPLEGRIRRGDAVERLRPKAMDVLCLLAASPGEVVERDRILGEVWGRTAVTDEPLTATVGELRRLLGDNRGAPAYIETIPKRGYRLLADVELLRPPGAGSGDDAADHDTAASSRRAVSSRRPAVWVTVAAALLLTIVALWRFDDATAPDPPPAPASLAVLPFSIAAMADDDRYFGDGLAQEILTTLATIDGLRVAARNSAFDFRDRRGDLDGIRDALAVDAVLDGSIRRAGNRLRIQVQLVDTRTGYNLWANTYDRELGDAFQLQTDIARAIAGQLSVELRGRKSDAAVPESPDSEAYLAFLRGSYLYETSNDEAGLREALDHFQAAVRLDPGFARARALLAGAWIRLGDYGYLPPDEAYAMGREQADRALELDPDLAEAHQMRGWIAMYNDWDWPAARRALTTALDLAPGDADVISANAALHYHLAHLGRAVALAEMAVARDPLRAWTHYNLAYFRFAAGDLDGAAAALAPIDQLVPGYPRAGLLRAQIDLASGAIDLAASRTESHPLLALMAEGLVAAARGDRVAALDAVAEMERDHASTSPYQIAEMYAWLGDTEAAFRWLERAYSIRDPGLAELLVDPLLESLEGDPRYADLLERVGFTADRPTPQ